MNKKSPLGKRVSIQTFRNPAKWYADAFDGSKHLGGAMGDAFIRYDKLVLAEKKPDELTFKEKIGKKLFGGRYFHENVEDIVRHYEKMHGVSFKSSVNRVNY